MRRLMLQAGPARSACNEGSYKGEQAMNRNVSWKAVAVLGAMLITAAGAWAQSHASYDKANEVTIKGTVVSLSQVAGGWFAGTHLNVKQADGNIIDIHVGPRSFYEGQHFT